MEVEFETAGKAGLQVGQMQEDLLALHEGAWGAAYSITFGFLRGGYSDPPETVLDCWGRGPRPPRGLPEVLRGGFRSPRGYVFEISKGGKVMTPTPKAKPRVIWSPVGRRTKE
eukprot:1179330-Prorocentrum_minimum.AAC.1